MIQKTVNRASRDAKGLCQFTVSATRFVPQPGITIVDSNFYAANPLNKA
jgi:hypothetical protein